MTDHPVSSFFNRMLRSPVEKVRGVAQGPSNGQAGCCVDKPMETFSPGVLFEGVFEGWSGYAKAGREIVFRLANHLYVQARHALRPGGSFFPSDIRLSALERTYVPDESPWLRFFGPDAKVVPEGKRRKIIYTMMETEIVHPDMVLQVNARFDELWTPTRWNADAFLRSGINVPVKTAHLGVDGTIYRPIRNQKLPKCRLLSTRHAGAEEVPEGFLFISVGIPSFRKGFDVLTQAFEAAFSKDKDCALICAVTHSSPNVPELASCRKLKSRIYSLEGKFDEHQMSRVYNACNAYVTASRGEGWNLPLCEAAACGLPVICGENTSHPEVAGQHAFMFKAEGSSPIVGADKVSPWYKGMPFTTFGKKSVAELVDLLRLVRENSPRVLHKAKRLQERVLRDWTWDSVSEEIACRLLEANT